ncbi:MAG: hypothetical protein ACI8XI_001020 [Woeseiaceae bacterium]|jgi:hypothetical protein
MSYNTMIIWLAKITSNNFWTVEDYPILCKTRPDSKDKSCSSNDENPSLIPENTVNRCEDLSENFDKIYRIKIMNLFFHDSCNSHTTGCTN